MLAAEKASGTDDIIAQLPASLDTDLAPHVAAPGPRQPAPADPIIKLEAATSIATGVDAAQAWAPRPNAISTQSVTSDPETTGQVRSFTTSPVDECGRRHALGHPRRCHGGCRSLSDRPGPGHGPLLRHRAGRRH
jgi:hypothetical protein